MKRIWIAVALLIAVLTICIGSLWWQMKALDRLERGLSNAVLLVEKEDDTAVQAVKAFTKDCLSVTETMTFLSRHVDGYPLKESATLLPVLLSAEDRNHFFSEAARTAFYIRELRRAEKPLFGNIF